MSTPETKMTTRGEVRDRTGAWLRWTGLGAVVLLAVASAVAPTSATSPRPLLSGLRRADRFNERFPGFKGAKPVPMGVFDANGLAMELSFFQTESPAGAVLDFYASEFARGQHHVDRQGADAQGTVSFYDETTGSLLSVHAFEKASASRHFTLVFASVVDGPEGMQLSAEPPPDLPHPEGAVTALRVDDKHGAHGVNTTVTQVAPGTTAEVATLYRGQLMSGGWRPVEERTARDVQMIDFERADQHLALSVSPLPKDGKAESVVTLIRETRSHEVRP